MSSDLEQCQDDLASAHREVEQLHRAIDSRAAIEQAKGILMTLLDGCDDDEAFHVLTMVSQATHIKVALVATQLRDGVVETNTVPEEFAAAFRKVLSRRSAAG